MTPRSSRPVPGRGHGHTHGHPYGFPQGDDHGHDHRDGSDTARLLIVEGGMHPRVTQLLREIAGIRVSTGADLYSALADVASSLATDPVRAIFVHASCDGFDLEAVPLAIHRIDPSIDAVLVADKASPEAIGKALECGFEAVLLPPHDAMRVHEVLAAIGLGHRAAAAQPGAELEHAQGQRLVELAIEHAREKARDRDDASELGLDEATARIISMDDPAAPRQQNPAVTPQEVAALAANPALLDALSLGRTSSVPRKPPREAARETPRETPAPIPAVEIVRALGDVDLVRAIRQGNDVVTRAVAIIRQHTGSDDVRFSAPVRGDATTSPRAERSSARSARVGIEATHFGDLLSATLSEAALSGWAAWLTEWLLLESEHAELDRLAFTDELTGAGNRRAFERIAVDELQQARKERRQISLVAFDIDDLKHYNDRFGHDAGDAVLRETVEVVRACIRRGDHIFRIGGDEFVVLFCDPSGPRAGGSASPESVEAVFARFQNAVRDMRFMQIGASGPGRVTVSAGLATYPWDGNDLKALLHHADQLALQSKRGGKNALTLGPTDGSPSLPDE
ncbi:MAG: GGDEF domain-containing protein [Phycisphaerales bacterium]|nr:GGDEF domain-containing protein [Phycisphaerales bacterium]